MAHRLPKIGNIYESPRRPEVAASDMLNGKEAAKRNVMAAERRFLHKYERPLQARRNRCPAPGEEAREARMVKLATGTVSKNVRDSQAACGRKPREAMCASIACTGDESLEMQSRQRAGREGAHRNRRRNLRASCCAAACAKAGRKGARRPSCM